MKRYNLSKIMREAHMIKRYMILHSLTHGVKTCADCLKLAWVNENNVTVSHWEYERMISSLDEAINQLKQ